MTGHYLGEFSITYKPVGHGRGANMANSRLCVFIVFCDFADDSVPLK